MFIAYQVDVLLQLLWIWNSFNNLAGLGSACQGAGLEKRDYATLTASICGLLDGKLVERCEEFLCNLTMF